MSRHDLVSAWNHAEDMVAVGPLTTNVCISHCVNNLCSHLQQCLWEKWWDRGRWVGSSDLVHWKD